MGFSETADWFVFVQKGFKTVETSGGPNVKRSSCGVTLRIKVVEVIWAALLCRDPGLGLIPAQPAVPRGVALQPC